MSSRKIEALFAVQLLFVQFIFRQQNSCPPAHYYRRDEPLPGWRTVFPGHRWTPEFSVAVQKSIRFVSYSKANCLVWFVCMWTASNLKIVMLGSPDMKRFQLLLRTSPERGRNQTSRTTVFKTLKSTPAEGYQVRNCCSEMKFRGNVEEHKWLIVARRLPLNCFKF